MCLSNDLRRVKSQPSMTGGPFAGISRAEGVVISLRNKYKAGHTISVVSALTGPLKRNYQDATQRPFTSKLLLCVAGNTFPSDKNGTARSMLQQLAEALRKFENNEVPLSRSITRHEVFSKEGEGSTAKTTSRPKRDARFKPRNRV